MTDSVAQTQTPSPGAASALPEDAASTRETAAAAGRAGEAASIIAAGQAGLAAGAIAVDQPEPTSVRMPAAPDYRRPRRFRVGSRRKNELSPRIAPSLTTPLATPTSQEPSGPDTAPAEQTIPDTQSELRNWIKDNSTLLSNASLLISVAALALNLLPDTGVLDPYIKALIFGAALLLLIEMHYQWPDDLQLHTFRHMSLPQNHSWRMVAFALIMQVATIVFAVWATLNTPLILAPLTALGVVVAFRQWYFRRFRGIAARGFGIVALVAVLLLSELLILAIWAVVADQSITIEMWENDRPGLTIEVGSDS
jgi:hypothetical protein